MVVIRILSIIIICKQIFNKVVSKDICYSLNLSESVDSHTERNTVENFTDSAKLQS